MLDKENEIYTRVYNKVIAEFPNADMDSSYQPYPSSFPHVTLYQSDSYTPSERTDSSLMPKFAVVSFEVNVYSNKKNGRKQECKKIMSIIDDEMHRMNFTRIVLTPIPDMNDASIYRLTARYTGEISNTHFYRR